MKAKNHFPPVGAIGKMYHHYIISWLIPKIRLE